MSMNRVPSEQSTHLHWLTQRSARRWCRLLMYTDSNIHFYLLFIGIVCVKSFIASAGLSPAPKTARNFTFGKSSCLELAIPLRPAAKRKHPRIFLCARLCSAPHICSVCVCVCVCVCGPATDCWLAWPVFLCIFNGAYEYQSYLIALWLFTNPHSLALRLPSVLHY